MQVYPQKIKEDQFQQQNWSSQRQLTDMGSQLGILQSNSTLLKPNEFSKRIIRAKTVKSFIQMTTLTMSSLQQQRLNKNQELRKIIKKVGMAQKFINQLRNYAYQLKNQRSKYQYRKRGLLPFFPDDIIYIIWGLGINLCTDIAAILYPIEIAFEYEGVGHQLTFILQIIFWIDLLMNFIICHINKQLDLLHNLKDIANYYLTTWFMIDLLSVLPDFGLEGLKPIKLLRLLRFFFYERRVEYNQSIELLRKQQSLRDELIVRDEYNIDLRIKKLMKIFLEMIILNHLFACLWIWICKFNVNKNWMERSDIKYANDYTKLIYAFFWAYQTITVIGYGDLEAHNFDEYLLSVIWMLIGVGYYSFTIGNITFILIQSNPNQEFDDQLLNLEDVTINMPESIQNDWIRFTKYNIQRNPFWAEDSKRIISELPHQLVLYTVAAVHKDILRIIPFMSNDINFSGSILPHSTLVCYQKYETIYHIGQSANDFFFLIKGDIRLCDNYGETLVRVMEGTCFGEIECIENSLRRWSAHAIEESVVLMCSSNYFSQFLEKESPQFFELQQMYKRRKILIIEQARIKRQRQSKLKRGSAINDVHQSNNKRESSQHLQELRFKIDLREYSSVQQDLMLQIVGQKQARNKIIREKFINAINKIRYYVQRSSKIKRISIHDPDYKIVRNLINNRIKDCAWEKLIQKKVGQKLLKNFEKVREDENLIKAFLQKSKQESNDRLARKKLIHIIRNILKFQKKEHQGINKIDIFYNKFHQLIYENAKNEKQEERKKQKQKLESIKKCGALEDQMKNLSSNLKKLVNLQTSLSMSIFEINQQEYDIDCLIADIKKALLQAKIGD
ncbi:unnamed protein product [Paramecium pentaurelia]|uniref:Cyclic nucleotide-binding domain-containing protein n=1 Tax=Paramecium pentaurelia TaxID=43138 RepID=A0A8S1XHT9_9CILI|nr:unnamed protein product [Paramecium pentaurelia]